MNGFEQGNTMQCLTTGKEHLSVQTNVQEICPRCRGDRWLRCPLPPWDPQYKSLIACDCLLQQRREKRSRQLVALSGLPMTHLKPTLRNFRPHVRGVQQAFRVMKDFIDRAHSVQETMHTSQRLAHLQLLGWIVLRGSVGVGKTHLAMAVSAAALELGIMTLFVTVPDLLDHLRATFAPSADTHYDELFEQMKCAELLVLDDLGTQKSSPWADEKLFQIFNYRYNHMLPTIVTLNEKAWPFVDERLQSRMSDCALVQMVYMHDAQDYRQRTR